jgi:hypothetical protein
MLVHNETKKIHHQQQPTTKTKTQSKERRMCTFHFLQHILRQYQPKKERKKLHWNFLRVLWQCNSSQFPVATINQQTQTKQNN